MKLQQQLYQLPDLKQKGGLYEKKISDGYEVLEINKGGWTEAIFVKDVANTVDDSDIELDKMKTHISEEEETDFDDVDDDDFPKESDDETDDEDFDDDKFIEEVIELHLKQTPRP